MFLISLIIIFLSPSYCRQTTTLSYQLLTQGQQISIPLYKYFQYANATEINQQQTTPGYKSIFDIKKNNTTFKSINQFPMEVNYYGKIVKLSDGNIYSSKTFYNQPVNIFLLQNNFIMMYIYNDKPSTNQQAKVIGLNLTNISSNNIKNNQKINCTSMQATQSINQLDQIFIICQVFSIDFQPRFQLIQILFTYNNQGFINGLFYNCTYNLNTLDTSCNQYALQHFEQLQFNNTLIKMNIFIYCADDLQQPINYTNPIIFYFQKPQQIKNVTSLSFIKCFSNSQYITPRENGFLSVFNHTVRFWSTNLTDNISSCQSTYITDVDIKFAASRVYHSIDITYYLLSNYTIIISSLYQTNYREIQVDLTGFIPTSFAMTETFMGISFVNQTNYFQLIFSLESLYPQLIDQQMFNNPNGTYNTSFLMSINNYFSRGYYAFFYHHQSNNLTLYEYYGYILTITPKKPTYITQTSSQQHQKNINYIIYLDSNVSYISQHIIIKIILRDFNDTNLIIFNHQKFLIDSSYININLSSLVIGPLAKFYVEAIPDKYINLQFINYYTTINITTILQENQHCSMKNLQFYKTNSKLIQMALNLQFNMLNPIFSLYYNSCIESCALSYKEQQQKFQFKCNQQDTIQFLTLLQPNTTKMIVLSKDKWLQYDQKSIQYCSIIGQYGICQQLNMTNVTLNETIISIKLVNFEIHQNETIDILVFIIQQKIIYYGTIHRYKNLAFYTNFNITQKQIQQLSKNNFVNINFDQQYNRFLLLQLISTNYSNQSIALLYDHPNRIKKGQFLGHLIKKYDYYEFINIITMNNLIIIISNSLNNQTVINQYIINQHYSVQKTRTYPLYGRKIIKNGSHTADNQFLYIEVQIEQGPHKGQTQYLIFCPSLSTLNILTHIIPKYSYIKFIQLIGKSKNNYPQSIGLNGNNLFAISIPNMVIQFNNNHINSKLTTTNPQDKQNINQSGNITFLLVDYSHTMHRAIYNYTLNEQYLVINYKSSKQPRVQINSTKKNNSYKLQIQKISGPVMQYYINVSPCIYLQTHPQVQDVFTSLQCLMNPNTQQFGKLLDFATLRLNTNTSVQIIITTQYAMCIQNHKINKEINYKLPTPAITCQISNISNISNHESNTLLVVCDALLTSTIYKLNLSNNSCSNFNGYVLRKPDQLIYQHFRMKIVKQNAVFQIPIGTLSNKIYFLTTFYYDSFSSPLFQLKYHQSDTFFTKDFSLDQKYVYILENSLFIFLLDISQLNQSIILPKLQITNEILANYLYSTENFVYYKPDNQFANKTINDIYQDNWETQVYGQIGTPTHAYYIRIDFNSTYGFIFKVQRFIVYNQYKDCKNTVLSKSKYWGNHSVISFKLCLLQLQEYRIFSNFMPLSSTNQLYYIQFYAINSSQINHTLQQLSPFRMQKVHTTSTFEIKKDEGKLIIPSLFNFLCYYLLKSQVRWTFILNKNYQQNPDDPDQCNAIITLKNQNYIKTIPLTIINTDPNPNQSYQAWIFRSIFMIIILVSLYKWYKNYKIKRNKKNKMNSNIFSHQFQSKVRMNTKRSSQVQLLSDSKSSSLL